MTEFFRHYCHYCCNGHYCHYCQYCHYYHYCNLKKKFCYNLSFWFGSQFAFLSFVTIWVIEFCHNFLVFEFCLKLCFSVLSQLDFVKFCQILSFVTVWFFEFCHKLCFWVLSQLVFFSFVTILTFEFCHKLSWVLSQFVFLSFVTRGSRYCWAWHKHSFETNKLTMFLKTEAAFP